MDKNVAVVLALVIGGIVTVQGPLNSQLARSTGGLPATAIALGVSFTAVALLTVIAGKTGGFSQVGQGAGATP